MKNQFLIVGGIAALLLLTGAREEPAPTPPPEVASSDGGYVELPTLSDSAVGAGASAVKLEAAKKSAAKEPAADMGSGEPKAVDARPEVIEYSPENCYICDALDSEIAKTGGEKTLPFRLVKKPLLDWMTDGPWFYWQSDGSRTDWVRLHGLGTLNGKRLDFLLQEWLKTQPEDRKTASRGQDGVTVCCCEGSDTAACLCNEEVRNGVDRWHCTCNAKYGSRHFMDTNGRPTGPAGGYRKLGVETPVVRLQSRATYSCPNCRRR